MSKPDWRTRLSRKWRERVFLAATREFTKPQASSFGIGAMLAATIAVFIIISALLFAAVGLYLIFFDFPNIVAALIGLIFLALAYLARPKIAVQSEGHLRGSFPTLESALDKISNELNAPKISTIELTSDWNAAIWQSFPRRDAHLILGVPLLYAAPPGAATAILAHEMAHLVNRDPQRGTLISAARQALDEWLVMLGYDEISPQMSDIAGAGEVARQTMAFVIFSLRAVLDRCTFFASQKAEYLADGLSARLVGEDAMRDALLLLAASDHLNNQLKSFIPAGGARGRETLDFLRSNAQLPDALVQERQEHIARSLLRSDTSHPPTAYRLAFLKTLGQENSFVLDDETWKKIWLELGPRLEALGAEVLNRRNVEAKDY